MSEFLKTANERLHSDTPNFFKKLRNWAGIIGGAAAGAATLPLLPNWARIALAVIAAICGGIAGASALTTTDKQLSQK